MATLKINVQYSENYNYYEGGEPCWKVKGGTSFIIEDFDADTIFYDRGLGFISQSPFFVFYICIYK